MPSEGNIASTMQSVYFDISSPGQRDQAIGLLFHYLKRRHYLKRQFQPKRVAHSKRTENNVEGSNYRSSSGRWVVGPESGAAQGLRARYEPRRERRKCGTSGN